MNYLKQKNLYWQKHHSSRDLRGNECALYFYLLEECDKPGGWVQELELRNSVLMDLLNISFRTYQAARQRLQAAGLIDFSTQSGSKYTSFCLYNADTKTFARTFAKNAKLSDELSDQVAAKVTGKVDAKLPPPLLINTKTETKTKTKKNTEAAASKIEKIKTEVILPWATDTFRDKWQLWRTYKHDQHREQYKTPITEQQALINLQQLAAGDEHTAIRIIEQSIGNGWKGFFELKNKTHDRTHQTPAASPIWRKPA